MFLEYFIKQNSSSSVENAFVWSSIYTQIKRDFE